MDVLTKSILSSGKDLAKLLTEELAKKALEIDLSADSTSQYTLLNRLIRSLDQYANKSKDLKYIGLVGHYSSGKSSTINSILKLTGTKDEREADLNPTDKVITLITHPDNSSDLILMGREGSAVPIRTSFVESEILNDVVLSDTPGSGDPDIVNELIQDFLPVCDWIFYFITATNPLDQADIPLLSQKATKLPFIPISFVITRTDEFRTDKLLPVSDKNLNSTKRDAFLGKLMSRLQHLVKDEELAMDRFIFIDNESQYNIEKLRGEFIQNSGSIDEKSLVNMHIHKVEYYKTGLNSIFSFFIKNLATKIQQCEGFVNTATENILHFDQSVQINSEKMHSLWLKNEHQFSEAHDQEKKNIRELIENSYSHIISSDKNYLEARRHLNSICEQQAYGYSGKLIGDLNVFIKQRLREIKQNIETNVGGGDMNTADISHLFVSRLDFNSYNSLVEIDYSKFNEPIDFVNVKLNGTLTDTKNSIRYKASVIRNTIEKELLINKLEELYEAGRDLININFDSYFHVIEMYQSAVLTKNTKDTIEKLRIGEKLDTLDKKFPESFITGMKRKAVDEVYPESDSSISSLRQKAEVICSKASALRNDLEKISVAKNEGATKLVKDTVDASILIDEVAYNKEQALNLIYQNRLSEVTENHKTNFSLYVAEIREAEKNRRKLVLLVAGGILILAIVAAVFYKFSDYASPTTSVGEIILGFVSTILLESLGVGFVYIKTNIKGLKKRKLSEFKISSKAAILRSFGESFWDELAKLVEEKVDGNNPFLRKKLNDKIDPILDALIGENQKVLNNLLEVFKSVTLLLKEHTDNLQVFYRKFSTVFLQAEENAEKISRITKEIKEQSIKPSFELLQETSDELIKVNQKIVSVKNF